LAGGIIYDVSVCCRPAAAAENLFDAEVDKYAAFRQLSSTADSPAGANSIIVD